MSRHPCRGAPTSTHEAAGTRGHLGTVTASGRWLFFPIPCGAAPCHVSGRWLLCRAWGVWRGSKPRNMADA